MSADALPSTVTGDYSLDDFLDVGEREDPADEADEPDDDAEAESVAVETESAADDRIPPRSVAPAEPTYGWSPDGAECTECGETATTRWREDGEYVCADCKEW